MRLPTAPGSAGKFKTDRQQRTETLKGKQRAPVHDRDERGDVECISGRGSTPPAVLLMSQDRWKIAAEFFMDYIDIFWYTKKTSKCCGFYGTENTMKRSKELFFELSAKLISVHPSRIGREIEAGLKFIGELWAFDRVTLSEFSLSSNEISIAHSYTAPGVPLAPLKDVDKSIPWIIEKLCFGEPVKLTAIPDDLPADAVVDREYFANQGLASALSLPLKVGQKIIGGCFFATFKKQQHWDAALVKELQYLTEILASALERSRASKMIDTHLQFEHLLSDISATYINVPREELGEVIRNDLGRLSRVLGADRCFFYSLPPDKKQFRITSAFAWWPEEDNDIYVELEKWRKSDPRFYDQLQYLFDHWLNRKIFKFKRLEELPDEAAALKKSFRKFGTKSVFSTPVSVGGEIVGALVLATTHEHRSWPDDLVSRLRLIGEVFANAIMRKRNEEKIAQAFSQIKELKDQIEADYHYLTEEIELEHNYGHIVGQSKALRRILTKVKQVAPTNAVVLLLGETGTGKGLIARSIHNAGKHSKRPMVQVNCAALSPNLIESELFGHEKGAFSGAVKKRVGRFELANGTTLFLDEIGELPMELQAKLLRVLQDGEFERVGGSQTIQTNARVIVATNRNLERAVAEGRFRRDLYYRLSVFPILIPPLRERLEDIPHFVSWFANKYSKGSGKNFKKVPMKTINALQRYAWPGNIRELENLIERAVITSTDNRLQLEIPISPESIADPSMNLSDVERSHILKVLRHSRWKIEGPNGAAEKLGLNPSTLRFRMKKLNVVRPSSFTER
jgi:transcriptional regulator with GAF, ATPase, and Fis domain